MRNNRKVSRRQRTTRAFRSLFFQGYLEDIFRNRALFLKRKALRFRTARSDKLTTIKYTKFNQYKKIMKVNKPAKIYEAPEINIVKLVVENGFGGSISVFDPNDTDPIESLENWAGWED